MPDNSLSLILYAQDAESRLCHQVDCLLEVLSDLTNRFEIVVIDDGSIDDTYAIACELASQFPQVQSARHSAPLGPSGALQTALRISTADIIIVQDHDQPIRHQELHRLWQLRNDPYLLMARPQPIAEIGGDDQPGYHRIDAFHQTVMNGSATRLLRRRAIERLSNVSQPGQRLVVDGLRDGALREEDSNHGVASDGLTHHHFKAPVRVRMTSAYQASEDTPITKPDVP